MKMLRVLALSLAVLALAPGQAAAAWQKIDEVKDDIAQPDSVTYVDPATVQKKGDLASASTLREFKDGRKWRSYITSEEFDCRKKLVRTLKFTSYSERMAKGTAKEEKSNARWAPVHSEEHSASEPTFSFVCSQKAAAGAVPVASAPAPAQDMQAALKAHLPKKPAPQIEKPLMADLNGDGRAEALVRYCLDEAEPGGKMAGASNAASLHCHLAVLDNAKGGWQLVARIGIGQGEVKGVKNGVILLETLTHGPKDPRCCPTQKRAARLALQNGKLVQLR